MTRQQIVKKVTQELFKKLNVQATPRVREENGNLQVLVETEEAGLLIGFHGETLKPLELILTLLISNKLGEFTRINLDIAGYKKQREEKLLVLAQEIKEQVKAQSSPQILPNLTASERRLIHLFFQDDKEVTTESQGEGEARQLIIKPR